MNPSSTSASSSTRIHTRRALRVARLVAPLAIATLLLAACGLLGSPDGPYLRLASPADGLVDVDRDTSITLFYETNGAPLDPVTIHGDSVRLVRTIDGRQLDAGITHDASTRTILVQPDFPLVYDAGYAVEITDAVEDESGRSFVPASVSFTTGFGFESAGSRTYVVSSDPRDGETGVFRDVAISTKFNASSVGVDRESSNESTVLLTETESGVPVEGNVTESGGRDSILFQPVNPLKAHTDYTFIITSDVLDVLGRPFLPYRITFRTGSEYESEPAGFSFERVLAYDGGPATSLVIGPDGRLYAPGLDGAVRRWDIEPDGTLLNLETYGGLGGRDLIGLAFDPDDPNVMYVSDNAPLTVPPSTAEDFTGRITRITMNGGALASATHETVVTGLPRSVGDHLTNSVGFDPSDSNILYVTQGSNTGAGAPDPAWGNREERLLTAAMLRLDLSLLGTLPLDVQTEDYEGTTGDYDPTAPGAPLTVYASGLRNAYDFVFHSNGSLYVPTNGSNGGSAPGTPDGVTPQVPAVDNLPPLPDYLFRVEEGGYYGHPNVLRGEYVLNGGNPTAGVDPGEVVDEPGFNGYPVGVVPTWNGFAREFCCNDSINGVIEYQSSSVLQGRLVLVRYGTGGDVVAVELDGAGDAVGQTQVAAGFENPLDLIEHPSTGDIYVAELVGWGEGRIQLLRVPRGD